MQVHIGRYQRGCESRVRCSASATAADGFRDVVNLVSGQSRNMRNGNGASHLLTVFIGNNFTFRRTRIGAENDAVFEETADDRRPSARRFRE